MSKENSKSKELLLFLWILINKELEKNNILERCDIINAKSGEKYGK